MMKDLTVIVAAYNVEKEIELCLKSLKKQTIINAEFIIVDDGSTDDTLNVVNNFIEKNNDKRFICFHKENGGLSDARNFGMKKAKGKFIVFVDGDDQLKNNDFLLNIFDYMHKDKLDVLEFNFIISKNNSEEKFFKNREDSALVSGKELFYQSIDNDKYYAYVWHYAFKNDFIKKYDFHFEKGIFIEDVLFMIPILLKAKKTKYINDVGYIYLQRDNSITGNQDRKHRIELVRDHLYVLGKVKNIINQTNLENKYRIKFINLIFNAYFVNILKALGYNISIDRKKICRFIKKEELDKKNLFKYSFLCFPQFILIPLCKLIIKIKP